MADDINNLILRHLQGLRTGQEEMRSEFREEFTRVNLRLAAIENSLADSLSIAAADRAKVDRLEKRIERIERRLEITD